MEQAYQQIKELVDAKIEQVVATELGEKAEVIEGLLSLQEPMCINDYQIGIYNGLAVALSTITGQAPKLYEYEEGGKENGISE